MSKQTKKQLKFSLKRDIIFKVRYDMDLMPE